MKEIIEYDKKINKLLEKRKIYQEELNNIDKQIKEKKEKLNIYNEALFIIQEVVKKTQKDLQFRISNLVNTALNALFKNKNYIFKMDLTIKRNKTEADIYLEKDGHRLNPLKDNGGGVVDILSFALRISCLLLNKHNRKTILLDEPFHNIQTKKLQERCALLIKELSTKLKIQFIVIVQTYQKHIINLADKVYEL